VARLAWPEGEVCSVAESLEQAGRLKIVSREPWLMLPAAAAEACAERVRATLDAFHRANPLVAGMPKEELRGRVARGLRPEIFRAVLGELAERKQVRVDGDTVMRAGRKIVLTTEEERAREQIESAFETAGLAVPRLAELLPRLPVDRKRAEKLVQLLLKEGALVKVSEELVFHASALGRLREMLAGYKASQGNRISVAAFKELTGISRKYAIPLLEYLDRAKVTRRLGDERVIL
jgi:selenocysteine-specific elongation factor